MKLLTLILLFLFIGPAAFADEERLSDHDTWWVMKNGEGFIQALTTDPLVYLDFESVELCAMFADSQDSVDCTNAMHQEDGSVHLYDESGAGWLRVTYNPKNCEELPEIAFTSWDKLVSAEVQIEGNSGWNVVLNVEADEGYVSAEQILEFLDWLKRGYAVTVTSVISTEDEQELVRVHEFPLSGSSGAIAAAQAACLQ